MNAFVFLWAGQQAMAIDCCPEDLGRSETIAARGRGGGLAIWIKANQE